MFIVIRNIITRRITKEGTTEKKRTQFVSSGECVADAMEIAEVGKEAWVNVYEKQCARNFMKFDETIRSNNNHTIYRTTVYVTFEDGNQMVITLDDHLLDADVNTATFID